uniref:Uncharacterized protein n=1 Tax=Rhizophora mucronata TaxID=61149 RepID=A0A2P2QVB9_RHIMU
MSKYNCTHAWKEFHEKSTKNSNFQMLTSTHMYPLSLFLSYFVNVKYVITRL